MRAVSPNCRPYGRRMLFQRFNRRTAAIFRESEYKRPTKTRALPAEWLFYPHDYAAVQYEIFLRVKPAPRDRRHQVKADMCGRSEILCTRAMAWIVIMVMFLAVEWQDLQLNGTRGREPEPLWISSSCASAKKTMQMEIRGRELSLQAI